MAETDILNPKKGFWAAINDNPNPNYGFERRSASNSTASKARLGAPYSRETMNQGFAFVMTYIDRPYSTVLRLKHFYEAFKGGYFTYVDHDGGGREHVGRFTTPVNAQETGNNKYTVQGLVFEEIPQARMNNYPADFVNWSRTINVVDDELKQAVATQSAAANAWALQLNPSLVAPSATDPSAYELINVAPSLYTVTPGNYDWAQIQYVGWGFRMQFRQAANLGQVSIKVDGVFVCIIDLSTGVAVPTGGQSTVTLPAGVTVANGLLTSINMPLDMHRVKVEAYAVGAGGGVAAIYPAVQVIV